VQDQDDERRADHDGHDQREADGSRSSCATSPTIAPLIRTTTIRKAIASRKAKSATPLAE
jgi:hypothetical protein